MYVSLLNSTFGTYVDTRHGKDMNVSDTTDMSRVTQRLLVYLFFFSFWSLIIREKRVYYRVNDNTFLSFM